MAKNKDCLFEQEMQDVRPLPTDNRVPRIKKPDADAALQARRAAATANHADPNPLTIPDTVEPVDPHDILGMKKDGVQEGVYRKLRLGKYPIQASLDLHRVTLADAREQVYQFVGDASRQGLRTVAIIHGKGADSVPPARMKSHVVHWLTQWEVVLAWHSAIPKQGGAGTTLLLLRKSSEQRRENRERWQKY